MVFTSTVVYLQLYMLLLLLGSGTVSQRSHMKFSHPKSRSKISNLLTTELFQSYILNTSRGSLYTRIFRLMRLSVFKYQLTKNGFSGPKRFWGFRETGPCLQGGRVTLASGPGYLSWRTKDSPGLQVKFYW